MKFKTRHITLLLFLFIQSIALSAQGQYGNAWIAFDQAYYKFPVAEDGIYRIPAPVLAESGVPANVIDAGDYQLFRAGQEVPIYVSAPAGPLEGSDFIEFYGTKNRGELDRQLYSDPDNEQLNPAYSLFNDTIFYFLTWSPGPHLRLAPVENDLTNLPEKAAWYMHREFIEYHDQPFKPTIDQGVAFSHFVNGEGFGSTASGNKTVNIPANNIYKPGPNGRIDVRMTIGQNTVYSYNVTLDNTEYHNASVQGVSVETFGFEIPNADLKNNPRLRVTRQGSSGNVRLGTVELQYPKEFVFEGESSIGFTMPNLSRMYLELTDFAAGGSPPLVYDLNNSTRIVSDMEAGLVRIALPATALEKQLIISSQENVRQIGPLMPVSFSDYSDDNPNYIIISHPALYQGEDGSTPVQDYVDYRSSQEGGNYNVGLYDIRDLYDQFGFGVPKHSLSIRNFIRWASTVWPSVEMVYIIGKGVEYYDSRVPDGVWEQGFFVPTFGFPGSDNLLIAPEGSAKPLFPIGRLAAINGNEVGLYLDKVKAFDANQTDLPQTIEDRAWMKHVLHLTGGRDANEQLNFANQMRNLGTILEESVFAARISAFSKANSDPVSTPISEQILRIIRDGTSVVNFFGHSSASTLDFQINNPQEWNNPGKYPIFSAMGCSAGKIHSPFRSLSEEFVLAENAGCIAFVSGSGSQYPSPLINWGEAWYESFGKDQYGNNLGESLIESYSSLEGLPTQYLLLLEQQTLNGDPALRFNPHPGPDLVIEGRTASISPQLIHTEIDSIELSLQIVNIGTNVRDSITVTVRHGDPSGKEEERLRMRIAVADYSTQVSLTIPVELDNAIGINTLIAEIDVEDEVEELPDPAAEMNNNLRRSNGAPGIDFIVFSNALRPVYPEDFSIVTKPDVECLALSSEPLASPTTYVFEIDTTEYFDSPLKQRMTSIQSGGLIGFKPSINLADETVYYWRVSPDSLDGLGYAWRTSSFVYKPGSDRGWNQSHYFQFLPDNLDNITLEEPSRKFRFDTIFSSFSLENRQFETGNDNARLFINGTTMIYWAWNGAVTNGLQVTVIDEKSVDFWKNSPPGLYGSHLPELQVLEGHANFPFWTDTEANRELLIDFLENTVPPGAYVLVWSINREDTPDGYMADTWALDSLTNSFGKNLFQVLEDQGAGLIRNSASTGAYPYAFLYQKDRSGFPVRESLASGPEQEILMDFVLGAQARSGNLESVVIGPASQWDRVDMTLENLDPGDRTNLEITGIASNGTETHLFEDAALNQDLTGVDPNTHPYLKLRFAVDDSLNRTMPQLPYWRVFYEGLPDAVYNTNISYSFKADTLQRGQDLELQVGVANYTPYPMDSLLVSFTLTNEVNEQQLFVRRYAALGAGEEIPVGFTTPTSALSPGDYTLIIELNSGREQAERDYANNIAVLYLRLTNDNVNPLLNVTFDGRHILNRDIVSSKPEIRVAVRDYYSFLPLTDSSAFTLKVTDPDGAVEMVEMDDPRVTFFPADPETVPEKNEAMILFRPEFQVDGIYTLEAQVKDASDVPSGDLSYQVEFEVITASMISHVYNYPNPFSTSTRFVYTLTGDTPPEHFKIQIMTVSGRIVREITELEIGPLEIGTHLTDYAWDGTDEFGDKLAAGIYLYRIVAKDATGESFDTLARQHDELFRKGFGKMVIIR